MMLPEKELAWGRTRNCMRELMEYGLKRKAEIGADKVFDFSLGNPSVPAPPCVNQAIIEALADPSVHAYTTAAGLPSLRTAIAEDLNRRFCMHVTMGDIYVTCGAAASLSITLRALLIPGEEVLAPAPFFTEYRVFTEASGGVLVPVVPADDMQINLAAVERALTDKTKAIILNSPNNPSGVIFSTENLQGLAEILRAHKAKTGKTVYLISDEPYRELVYDGAAAHSPVEYYDDAIMCYSFSKSLSVPGERLGYIAVSDRAAAHADIYAAIMGAGRALGYVNPPSLFQRVIEKCLGQVSDLSVYARNRELLCSGLSALGYEFIKPQGAFYLFVKSPIPDAAAFSERAKAYELLLPPSNDFGCTGYIRIAYCVAPEVIQNAMPAFAALIAEYKS